MFGIPNLVLNRPDFISAAPPLTRRLDCALNCLADSKTYSILPVNFAIMSSSTSESSIWIATGACLLSSISLESCCLCFEPVSVDEITVRSVSCKVDISVKHLSSMPSFSWRSLYTFKSLSASSIYKSSIVSSF